MTEHEHDHDEEQQARRPRVVDKRISARPADAAPQERPAPPAPGEPEETFRPPPRAETEPPAAPETAGPTADPGDERVWTPEQEAEAQRIVDEIDRVPARDWVVSSAMNLVNVAGVKLDRGDLPGAQLAIDALSGILNETGSRLGDAHPGLRQVLAQLQMAYAQVIQSPGDTRGAPG
jgi:hypothetical protein